MNWYLEVLKKYAVFGGRARRKEYWYFQLFYILISIVILIIDGVIGVDGLLFMLYTLAMLIPQLAVCVLRLHDSGKSGWWILISFVPLVSIVLLVFMVQDSQLGENQYGPNPKLAEA